MFDCYQASYLQLRDMGTMTPRNSRRSAPFHQNSWRKDIVSYRRGRLQRSLARLRTHPAVNPTGPHGPHGCLPITSASPNEQHPSNHATKGIIPTLFEDLVRRQLGIHPSTDHPVAAARLRHYITAARAVTSPPSLSDPRFIARIATGGDPGHLKNTKLLSSLASKPVDVPPQSQSVRDIHLAIKKARERHAYASVQQKQPVPAQLPPCPRRSPRKRLRTQNEKIPSMPDKQSDKNNQNSARSGELQAFRPSPESVRRTRSEAARARRTTAKKTPSECCFCPDPQSFEGGEIQSELIGPFVDRRGNAKLFVHFDCACWAPQVYTDPSNGHLRRVYDEYCRGRKLKCSSCGQKGATIGCYIQRCKKVFHYRCLQSAKAYCVERFFAAFCETHSHLGRKPSYNIVMEAATIADVSAAQRREDTTYGLDAPHSRYTLLRRRETEIIFSRKWRVASHTGLSETGKVIFSHRRKAILRKTDRISVDDCVRVVKTSALDIASGRLAFMALAHKGDAANDVSAVEARAAIASRESTALFLLRNLRNSREWKTGDVEIVRSIPIESKQLQVSDGNQREGSVAIKQSIEVNVTSAKGKDMTNLSGTKRPAVAESQSLNGYRGRKKQKILANPGICDALNSSMPEKPNKDLVSRKLPSYPRSGTRGSNLKRASLGSAFTAQSRDPKDVGSHLAFENGFPRTYSAVGDPTESIDQTDEARLVVQNDLPETTFQTEPCSQGSDELRKIVVEISGKASESELPEVVTKSAWDAFLEEQLPRERLLRPDDCKADSLRNMARLWSLLTPTERNAYEERAQVSSLPKWNHPKETGVVVPQQEERVNREAGLFSTASVPGRIIPSGPMLRAKSKALDDEVRQSVALKLGRDGREDVRNGLVGINAPNWDDLFPSKLDDALCPSGGSDEIIQAKLERVRPPPTRGNAKS